MPYRGPSGLKKSDTIRRYAARMDNDDLYGSAEGRRFRRRRIPLWREIATSIRDSLRDGTWQEGERLPSEVQLGERYGANRHTVRRAVAWLADLGLVTVRQGHGTFVAKQVVEYPVGARTRFTENFQQYVADARGVLLEAKTVSADRAVANALELPTGARCLCMTALRRSEGKPLGLTDHWFDADAFAEMPTLFEEFGSITACYKAMGIADFRRRETRVSARLPKTREAELLQTPRTRPLIITSAINTDPAGRVIEYGITRFSADRTTIVFES